MSASDAFNMFPAVGSVWRVLGVSRVSSERLLMMNFRRSSGNLSTWISSSPPCCSTCKIMRTRRGTHARRSLRKSWKLLMPFPARVIFAAQFALDVFSSVPSTEQHHRTHREIDGGVTGEIFLIREEWRSTCRGQSRISDFFKDVHGVRIKCECVTDKGPCVHRIFKRNWLFVFVSMETSIVPLRLIIRSWNPIRCIDRWLRVQTKTLAAFDWRVS